MIVRHMRYAGGWFRQYHKRIIVISVIGFVLLLTIIQFRYPSDLLLPFTKIDGVEVGGWSKANAILALDGDYRENSISVYFGSEATLYASIKPSDIGLTVKNDKRIQNLDYPWYLRLVPTSLFWAYLVTDPSDAEYSRQDDILATYIKDHFGDECKIQPINASLKVVNDSIKVQKGSFGGNCVLSDVKSQLSQVHLTLTGNNKITLHVDVIPADVGDGNAQMLAEQIEQGIKNGVPIKTSGVSAVIPRDTLLDWLDFTVSNGAIDYNFNADRASKYLTDTFATDVAVDAGTTTIHTYNFGETSREIGNNGQALDVVGTLSRMKGFVSGELEQVIPAVASTAPTIVYDRSYSADYVGLAALIQNFATAHSGDYGVVLNELSGQYRRATFQPSKSFTTASTYKLYVAYSTLRRIESGAWHWNDQITGGKDLTKCFDDMIVLSDNPCGLALLKKVGFVDITKEAHDIGCIGTSFLGNDGIKTTPEDLALLLGLLQTGQVLNQQSSRDILISAMKRNVYRQGIPKGVSAVVADKVGFLSGLLHDAAIVYSSTGPYVLVIMTDGSSWGNIAELTRQIEALRIQ